MPYQAYEFCVALRTHPFQALQDPTPRRAFRVSFGRKKGDEAFVGNPRNMHGNVYF